MSEWSGWKRLWLVLSLLFGLPIAAVYFESSETMYRSVPFTAAESNLPQPQLDNLFWPRAWKIAREAGCQETTAKVDKEIGYDGSGYTITCNPRLKSRIGYAVLYGAIPGLIFWIIGFLVAWIREGFRRPKSPT